MVIALDTLDASTQLVPFIVGNVIQGMMEINKLVAGPRSVLLVRMGIMIVAIRALYN